MTAISLIHQFLESSTERFPEQLAVVHEKRRATYSQINRLANQLSRMLISIGIGRDDRVVLLVENSIEYIFSYYGILKTGAVAVPLNTDLKPDGIAELLRLLKPAALIFSSQFERTINNLEPCVLSGILALRASPDQTPSVSSGGWPSLHEQISPYSEDNPDVRIEPESCAGIIFTSGSEGKPKGVMLSHKNIVANTRSIVACLGLCAQDVQMTVLPFHYVMGKSLLNTHFSVGGRVVINNKFAYTAAVLKQMADEAVTGFSGVPSTYAHLLYKSPLADYKDRLPALRYCSQAGGHMPRQIKYELMRVLPPHTKLIIMYGATEASARLTFLPPDLLTEKIESIGVPIPGVAIDILSAEGHPVSSPGVGELVARGDNIMLGYYEDEVATRRVLDEHGYHTGDLGYRDADGYLFVTGRKDEQVKVGGHRINPRDVEDTVVDSGLIMECHILAIPDDYYGSRLAGIAVPIPGSSATLDRLMEYCRGKLPKYKIPEPLFFVDAIPKTSNGKPDRAGCSSLFFKELNGRKEPINNRKDSPHEEP